MKKFSPKKFFRRGELKSKLEIETLAKLKRSRGIANVTYETSSFPYTIRKNYLPDFTVVTRSGKTIHIETKGWFRPEDRVKMRAVKESNPGVDIRLVFPSNNKLNKGSKMRYSDWCEKYNYTYAVGAIPMEWFNT